ncbi:MAG: DUF502 domain-containing protein [Phycisphaerae bacterium]|jgi:uncharacterized membrane protein
MAKNKESLWAQMKRDVRSRLISGTAVLVPVAITIAILRWLFLWMSGFLTPAVKALFNVENLRNHLGPQGADFVIRHVNIIAPVVAVVLLVVLLYCIGALARRVVGKRVLAIGEAILLRIPVVKPIYSAVKQVVEAVSLPDRGAFKAVVLVHFPHPRMWAVGFLTGSIADQTGKRMYKVFIPTAPNPTTGFYEFIEPEELMVTDIPVDMAFKMIISSGIIAPDKYNARPIGLEYM